MCNDSLVLGPPWISDPVGKTSELRLASKKKKVLLSTTWESTF